MSIKTFLKLFFILSIVITACKKEEKPIENPFQPNTEIGANTFMFKVNGGEVISSQVGYLATSPRISVYYSHIEPIYGSYFFGLEGTKIYLEENKYIGINILSMPSIGKYKLSEYVTSGKGNYAYFYNLKPIELYYYTDVNNTGELNITKLDTTNHIISGTFTFKARQWCLSGNCNGVVAIDGQFDVTYKPNNRANYY